MAHCKKFTRAACGHMFKHYERAKDENGEYVKFGNQNIDTRKSYLNYNLAPTHRNGQGAFVKERCSEVKMQNRKDVNVMCSWVVTAPKELQDNEIAKFFQETYKFLSERYGKDNVVSSYVHMDEITPHMHYSFVPVVEDKKKNILKVSAKEAINRKDLQSFHEDLSEYLEKVFGRNVGVLNDATREGNKSVKELKQGTAKKELEEMKDKAEFFIKLRKLNEESISIAVKDIVSLQDKKCGLEEEINELEKILIGRKMTAWEVEKINPIKNLFGNIKNISIEDVKKLKRMAMSTLRDNMELNKTTIELNKAKVEIEELKIKNKMLESKVPTMDQKIKEEERKIKIQEQVQELKEENAEWQKLIEKIIEGINKLPEEEREYMRNIISPTEESEQSYSYDEYDEWEM